MEFKTKKRKIIMKKMILKLSLVSFLLLLGTDVSANNDKTKEITEIDKKIKGGTIVDEAFETKPIIDTIKGGGKPKDIANDTNISLASIKENYQISRKDLNYPPYRCYIYHANKSSSEIGVSHDSNISFTIEKSQLIEGDTIVVTNNQTVKGNKNFPMFIIEWIEIKK